MNRNISNLTLKEFLTIVNDQNKMHPDSAYSGKVEEYNFEQPFDIILSSFNRYGLDFTLREQQTDRWKNHGNYVKKDEEGEILRDENGMLIYHDEESIKTIIPEEKRWIFEHAIYDETHNVIAARTQDEWGCLLLKSEEAYEGFGLGEELLFQHRKIRDFRPSGGYSPQGLHCEKKAFKRRVMDNLDNGLYDNLTDERRQEILNSVSNISTFVERYDHEKNKHAYDFNNSEDFLYHIEERFVLIYNRKLYDLLDDKELDVYSDKNQMLLQDGIIAYVDLLGTPETDRIFKSYAKTPEAFDQSLQLLADVNQTTKFECYKRDMNLFQKSEITVVNEGRDFADININHTLNNDYQLQKAVSDKIKRVLDPYEEKWNIIHEVADGMATDILEKNDNLYQDKLNNQKPKMKKTLRP